MVNIRIKVIIDFILIIICFSFQSSVYLGVPAFSFRTDYCNNAKIFRKQLYIQFTPSYLKSIQNTFLKTT